MTVIAAGQVTMCAEVGMAALMDLLGRSPGEFTAICTQSSGGGFRPRVVPSDAAATYIDSLADRETMDIWYSVNPTSGPESARKGRARDVTRLAALWADLDVKEGGCVSGEVAEEIIEKLSGVLGTRPTVVVHSGHGLQPLWILDRTDELVLDTEAKWDRARKLVDRWGSLVHYAAAECGAKVDSVFNLDRILRAPGYINNKDPREPVRTRAVLDAGECLPLDWVRDVLADCAPAARESTCGREVTQTAENRAYAGFGSPIKRRIDGWIRSTLQHIGTELESLADWEPGRTDESGRGWEKRCSDAAYRLGALFRADWNALGEDEALQVFLGYAPTDEGWTDSDLRDKWASQSHRAEPAAFPRALEVEDPGNAAVAGPERPACRGAEVVGLDLGEEAFERSVARKLLEMRAMEEARRRFKAENAGYDDHEAFDAGLLKDLLARPDDPPHRIQRLVPWEAGTVVVAARKTGKTTFNLNLARALITGEPFLGRFETRAIETNARVGVLNYEVSGATFAQWASEAGIDPRRLFVVNLRGKRNPLGHPGDRLRLASILRAQNIESLFVDPFGRAYTGVNQNDSGEVGAWLANLDRFARGEVGALDLVLSVHAGWNQERTRGSSAIEDWGDSIVNLTTDNKGTRFLRAMGRDVAVDEDRLTYDERSRTLSLSGGGSRAQVRTDTKGEALLPNVLDCLEVEAGRSVRQVRQALRDRDAVFQDAHVSRALSLGVERGQIRVVDHGLGKTKEHFLATHARPTRASIGSVFAGQ